MKKFIIIVILIFFITGCAYYPHLTNIPLIEEKGELKLEGGISVLPPFIHTSVSYGLTKNIAIQIAGDIGSDSHYYLQGMVGLFKNFPKNSIIELYCGFGYGYSRTLRNANHGSLFGNYQSYFLQFDYGKFNKKIEYGLGLKSGYLYSKMTDNNFYNTFNENIFTLKINNIIVEPTLFLRFGWEKLKIQTAIGACWLFQFTNTNKKLPYFPASFGLGITYNFNTKREK